LALAFERKLVASHDIRDSFEPPIWIPACAGMTASINGLTAVTRIPLRSFRATKTRPSCSPEEAAPSAA